MVCIHNHWPTLCNFWATDSDPAVKQILLTMNEKQSFVIEDLDDYHLVIKGDEEYRVRQELEAEVRSFLFRFCVGP
jgi:TFIIH basal transcription factor complex TTD-A subunit